MKITEIKIGDRVCDKQSKFPMTVTGIFTTLDSIQNPEEGTVYLDFEGNEGDIWEEEVQDLEFVKD